jgi:sialate O-acetylesterase
LGEVRRGRFKLTLAGIPVGGPYTVTLRIGDESATVDDVRVGDVWLAAGQSNMQGCGRRAHAATPHREVRAFYMDDRWDVARDPIHNMWDCVDQVHIDLAGGVRPEENVQTGVGPGVAFARELYKRTGVPQGVIASAHGGTSMAQWDVRRKGEGGNSLYGATVRRLRKNGTRVAGVIWYQGESDAFPEASADYRRRMTALVRALRRDTGVSDLPLAVVQISRVVTDMGFDAAAWNAVQEQQRQIAAADDRVVLVPAIDLMLDDAIHIGGPDVNRLGRRLAQAMHALCSAAEPPPPELARISVQADPVNGQADLHVQYRHVQGKLRAGGRPVGFAVGEQPVIYDTQLVGDTVVVRTQLSPAAANDALLSYGYGRDPVCNITDAADRALPVFGPLRVGPARALGPYVRSPQISKLLPGAGDLTGLSLPSLDDLAWRQQAFDNGFCDLHSEIGARAPADLLLLLRARARYQSGSRRCRVRSGAGGEGRPRVGHRAGHQQWEGMGRARAVRAARPVKDVTRGRAAAVRHADVAGRIEEIADV